MTDVLKVGIRAKGRNELISYREGKRLTARQQIAAKCYECAGGYADGAEDCGLTDCALYPLHPYNPNKTKGKSKGNPANFKR